MASGRKKVVAFINEKSHGKKVAKNVFTRSREFTPNFQIFKFPKAGGAAETSDCL